MDVRSAHMARRKMSHVIDELYTALFRAGGKKVELRLLKEEKGLRLIGRGDFAPEHKKDLERMAELLTPAVRSPALVEAYWELAGGDQYTSDSEMSLVGQMLDEVKVEFTGEEIALDLFLYF